MSTTKYQFFLRAEGSDKTTNILVKRVRAYDEDIWYTFPDEFQKLDVHKALAELGPIKSAIKSLKSRGQFRSVLVSLAGDLEKTYVDNEGNFIFQDFMLAEYYPAPGQPPPAQPTGISDLTECLSKLAGEKEEPVKDIIKHFLVEKFSSKNKNVEAWCESFEKESSRFKLTGQRKIEVFKSCLDSSMSAWFAISQRKLGISAEWDLWKADLISAFGDNSWKSIRHAFEFRYLNGSYIEYALKKEKLLLELDRNLTELFMLDLIVVGLPIHIQNSLNKNSVVTVKHLHLKLKKFEAGDRIFENDNKVKYQNSNNFGSSATSSNFKVKSEEVNKNKSKIFVNNSQFKRPLNRKPCSICSKKGFPGRYHPESFCLFKDEGPSVKKEMNNIELESSSISESSDNDQKN